MKNDTEQWRGLSLRLLEIAHGIADRDWGKLAMSIPARPEHDADLVTSSAADALRTAADTVDRLREELETERLRLAACGVAAMSNTESTVAQRIDRSNPYWSASYGDVCAAVDREMRLRERIATLEALVLDVMAIRGDQYADWCDRATAALEEEP